MSIVVKRFRSVNFYFTPKSKSIQRRANYYFLFFKRCLFPSCCASFSIIVEVVEGLESLLNIIEFIKQSRKKQKKSDLQ